LLSTKAFHCSVLAVPPKVVEVEVRDPSQIVVGAPADVIHFVLAYLSDGSTLRRR
jgi:hypothetical protein